MEIVIRDMTIYRVEVSSEHWLWVSISTSDGYTGWGDASDSGDDEVAAHILKRFSSQLLGRDPWATRISSRSLQQLPPFQRPNRWESTAASAIDQALWDLKAQFMGVPLGVAIGGPRVSSIPLYANLNRALKVDRSPEKYAQSAVEAIHEGFSVVKCTPFDEVNPYDVIPNLDPGLERLGAVLRKIPLSRIAIDCHARFHPSTVPELLRSLPKNERPYWIEDPVSQQFWGQAKDVLDNTIRWAAGETANSVSESLSWISPPGVSVLMPDVKHVGGVTAVESVMKVAGEQGVWVSCHNPSSPIATAISAHLSVLSLGIPLEYPWGHATWRKNATTPAEPVWDGIYHLSCTPGIGLAPKPEFLQENGKEWDSGAWIPVTR